MKCAAKSLLIAGAVCLTMQAACLAAPAKTNAAPAASSPKQLQYAAQAVPLDVVGEVVDTWCYASKTVGPGFGPEHANCARACAHGGVTLGIVDDRGNLYIAAKHKAYGGCQELMEPFVAKRVRAHGYLAKAGGCNVMKIMSVEELGPGDKPLGSQGAGDSAKPASAKYHGQKPGTSVK